MYFVSSRYYISEWGRFIQPIDPIGLSSTNINGLNLYGYGSNNPVKKAYKNKTNLNEGINSNISNFKNNILLNASKEKIQNMKFLMDLKTEWFFLDEPKFFHLTDEGLIVAGGSLSLLKTDIYKNEVDLWSIYASFGNISSEVKLDIINKQINADISTELFKIGYEGLFIDAEINILGLGCSANIGADEVSVGATLGLLGGDISIKYKRIFQAFVCWILGVYE